MDTFKAEIERKYRRIAKLPEPLLSFTVPIRKKAIDYLGLTQGSSVLDIGCGTGASFPYLEEAIGESGMILGIEPSASMISVANARVIRRGWNNITLWEGTVEEIQTDESYDGALLFAVHDVFNSIEGLRKIHTLLKDGARIVCVGPKTQDKGSLRIFNPLLHLLFKRMAISQDNMDIPWCLVEEMFQTESILEEKWGLIFIYVGCK